MSQKPAGFDKRTDKWRRAVVDIHNRNQEPYESARALAVIYQAQSRKGQLLMFLWLAAQFFALGWNLRRMSNEKPIRAVPEKEGDDAEA